jgi:hypothetical protein
MNREIHVPLREGVGVRFPRATRPPIAPIGRAQNAKDNRDAAGAVSRAEILVFTM